MHVTMRTPFSGWYPVVSTFTPLRHRVKHTLRVQYSDYDNLHAYEVNMNN